MQLLFEKGATTLSEFWQVNTREIKNYISIDSPYKVPGNLESVIDSH
jgi:hypothetical protein